VIEENDISMIGFNRLFNFFSFAAANKIPRFRNLTRAYNDSYRLSTS
jgi:hypothetical protein